jgi:SRSO17 transposase
MSLLKQPQARALLADAMVSEGLVRGCAEHLDAFLKRYLPVFDRKEQRDHAVRIVQGRLSGLERKTTEPIAIQAGQHRKPLQNFVGAASWDDETLMAQIRQHVRNELADPQAVLVLDSSGFPKKGTESCGVDRQWCGRLGKVDNCQVGVFLVYAARGGNAPLGRQLYLGKTWASDAKRRRRCHVPAAVRFQEKWQIGVALVDQAADLPHGWVAADDEFGRITAFRRQLRQRRHCYVLDVPASTWVRDLETRVRRRPGQVRRDRKPPFERVDEWAGRQPQTRWQKLLVRDGAKGPLEVEALCVTVHTKADSRICTDEERLLVIRTRDPQSEVSFALCHADRRVPVAELVRVKVQRHRIEEVFAQAKGEVGLAHYEVRGWVGWHHHMTLSLLALWFLVLERRRLGGKNPGRHGRSGPPDRGPLAASPGTRTGGHRTRGQSRAAA